MNKEMKNRIEKAVAIEARYYFKKWMEDIDAYEEDYKDYIYKPAVESMTGNELKDFFFLGGLDYLGETYDAVWKGNHAPELVDNEDCVIFIDSDGDFHIMPYIDYKDIAKRLMI